MIRTAVKALARPAGNPAAAWFAPAAILALIAWGALSPQDPLPKYFWAQDKFEHLGAFMLLSAALIFALQKRATAIAVIFCFALAIGIEIAQAMFTAHRTPSWKDMFAGMMGTLAGVAFHHVARQILQDRMDA